MKAPTFGRFILQLEHLFVEDGGKFSKLLITLILSRGTLDPAQLDVAALNKDRNIFCVFSFLYIHLIHIKSNKVCSMGPNFVIE